MKTPIQKERDDLAIKIAKLHRDIPGTSIFVLLHPDRGGDATLKQVWRGENPRREDPWFVARNSAKLSEISSAKTPIEFVCELAANCAQPVILVYIVDPDDDPSVVVLGRIRKSDGQTEAWDWTRGNSGVDCGPDGFVALDGNLYYK